MLDSFGLVSAYVSLSLLLLAMLLYTSWSWILKAVMISAVSMFFYITYLSIPDFFGWPTAHHQPEKLQLVALYIDAPNKIYLWGHDLALGVEGRRPRAYELTYTVKLNDTLNKASHRLKKGFPMIVELRPIAPVQGQIKNGELNQSEDLIDLLIYDVPEQLLPAEKK